MVMITKDITVTNPKGIHARPSALIVQTAMDFHSEITLELDGSSADARQIIDVLSLGAHCGAVLKVTVSGPDEKDALKTLEEIFALNFNDDPM